MDRLHIDSHQNRECDIDLLRILLQGKWRLKVLQEIVKGPIRLSQLTRALPGCSKKVIIDALHSLESIGWIERHEYPLKAKRVEYSLAAEREQAVRRATALVSASSTSEETNMPCADHSVCIDPS